MNILKTIIAAIALFFTTQHYAQDISKALTKGDNAKDFVLKNAKGEDIRLYDLLKKGKVVLTWYRGGWCPYCNVALGQLQEVLPQIKAEGATLVALTPELPDYSLSTQEKNELEFEVLTDLNNDVARAYGIVFTLDAKTGKYYEEKLQLSVRNATSSSELPVPATYIIDSKGKIRYAYINPDYKQRVDVKTLIKELKQID